MLDTYKQRAEEVFNLHAKSFCTIPKCDHKECGHPKVVKIDEYINLARMFGLIYTSSDITSFNARVKASGLTHLTLENFIELLEIKLKSSNPLSIHDIEKALRDSYNVLDYHGQGKLSSVDLKHMLASLSNGECNPQLYNKLVNSTIGKNPRFVTQDNFVDILMPSIEYALEMIQESNLTRFTKSQKKARKKKEYRERRKQNRSETKREKRKREAEVRHSMLASMSIEERREFILNERKEKKLLEAKIEEHLINSFKNGVVICINCGFEDKMTDKELTSLAKQISIVYSGIKKKMYNFQLHLSKLQENGILYEKLKKIDYHKWIIHSHKEDFWNIFDPKLIVILSPDAEEELEDIEQDKIYIIGGLVDVNNLKNETRIQAMLLGLECRKFPLSKYDKCKKKVLTIPTVVDIMAARLNGNTWEEAFYKFLPQNRLYKPNE